MALDQIVSEFNNVAYLPIDFAFPQCFEMTELALKLQRAFLENEMDHLITQLNQRVINIFSH